MPSPAKPQEPEAAPRVRSTFGQQGRPRRRMSTKTAVMSPEARRALEERNRALIEEAVAQGRVTKCPVRWASGAVQGGGFGSQET
jgi:hypothetical protein